LIVDNLLNDAVVTVVCDACGKKELDVLRVKEGVAAPKGWRRRVWRPGILAPDAKPDQHYCSTPCLLAGMEKDGTPLQP
jgi:hypothetical protein